MKDQNISMRQMMTLLFIALVALCAEVVPGLSGAGGALWLAPLLAALPVLGFLFLAFVRPQEERRRDLGEQFSSILGAWGGKLAALLFLLWGLFLLVVNIARCARRLTVAGGTPVFFSAIVLLLAVFMAARELPAFARTCEIFYLAIGLGLLGIILLACFRLEPDYILLFTKAELSKVPSAAVSMLGVSCVGLYSLFMAGDITVREKDRARCLRWVIAFFLVLTVILVLILGTFGAALVSVMERPFFQMVAGLGLTGAFQRLEALVSALWMLGDIALLGMLLFAVKRLTANMTGKKQSPVTVIIAGVVAFFGGELLSRQEGLLQLSLQEILPLGSLLVGAVLLLLFFWSNWKERRGKKSANAKT